MHLKGEEKALQKESPERGLRVGALKCCGKILTAFPFSLYGCYCQEAAGEQ